MELEYYQEKFDKLTDMKKGSRRDMLLANIMTQMEANFKIPLMQNLDWEEENPKIINLYREISFSRTL
jgi:hypothetical protein